MARAGELRIGASGYSYRDWRASYYPEDLPAREWLPHYAREFDTVEINNTFYRMPTEKVARQWGEAVPDGFLFAFKTSRYVTHMKRLLPGGEYPRAVDTLLDRLKPLGEKLGALLFQLPPSMALDEERLRAFLKRLPARDVRYAFEFRHDSWYTEEVLAMLGEYGIALCVHDFADAGGGREQGRHTPLEVTADLVYVRFHGPQHAYGGVYGGRRLAPWLKHAEAWRRQGRDVLCYFNNDQKAAAIEDMRWMTAREEAHARAAAK